MKLKNIIISFFLLFVYSISFAHSLTVHDHGFHAEHQHEFSYEQATEHNHKHHSHSNQTKPKTAHINHNDHCDEGFFDLITCVLTDLTHHHHNDCNIEHQPTDNTKRLTSKSNGKIVSNYNTYSLPIIDFHPKEYQSNYQLKTDNKSILIDTYPLRGPPYL